MYGEAANPLGQTVYRQGLRPVMKLTADAPCAVYDSAISAVNKDMRQTVVYQANRGWFWELWIDSRLVVFGWCESQERAQLNARLA